MQAALRPAGFDDLPGWADDEHRAAIVAFARSARYLTSAEKPYRTGTLGVSVADFRDAFAALDAGTGSERDARAYFETFFRPFRIGERQGGFVTAYYEPEIEVAPDRDSRFRHPFLRRPADLVELAPGAAPALAAAGLSWARKTAEGHVEHPDRRAIESGALAGRGLEIAWAASRVDVFFAHIQGAARLLYPGGRVTRITFDGKSGHPFTAIGRVLIERGALAERDVTMASIRDWLARHLDEADGLLWQNRSFIFFREAPVDDVGLGPIAAAKVPLTAGRSIAVDRQVHTFGTPFYIDASDLMHLSGPVPFRRLMIAQDTGSAILGPARADLFAGSGAAAGDEAGSVKHRAGFHVLLPLPAAARLSP